MVDETSDLTQNPAMGDLEHERDVSTVNESVPYQGEAGTNPGWWSLA